MSTDRNRMETIGPGGKTILVTGAAGFIGAATVRKLLKSGRKGLTVVGLDSLSSYYDPALKERRLEQLGALAASEAVRDAGRVWRFVKGDVTDRALLETLFSEYRFEVVIHLAAQAGVRYSIDHPDVYMESNIFGSYAVLEACRRAGSVRHLVMASSSSVYGEGCEVPFSTDQKTDSPVSLYAATKKSAELIAYAYAKLYRIPVTCLRFFTVYGPEGRPDMAYFKFAELFRSGGTVELYGNGECRRDFTYIDDITECVARIAEKAPVPGPDGTGKAPFAVYNIGRQDPVVMRDFVRILTEELRRAGVLPDDFIPEEHIRCLPMQPGDVEETFADCGPLERELGYAPQTDIRSGLRAFAEWYKEYTAW